MTFLMCNNFCQNLGSSLSRVLSPSPRFTSTSTHNNNFHQNSPRWLFLSYSWKYVGSLSKKVVVQFFSRVIKMSTEIAVFLGQCSHHIQNLSLTTGKNSGPTIISPEYSTLAATSTTARSQNQFLFQCLSQTPLRSNPL